MEDRKHVVANCVSALLGCLTWTGCLGTTLLGVAVLGGMVMGWDWQHLGRLWLYTASGTVVALVVFAVSSVCWPGVHDKLLESAGSAVHFANQAATESSLGRYDRALRMAQMAIDRDPSFKQAWYNKGVALMGLGRPEEAQAAFHAALQIDDGFWQAWHNKGMALEAQGKSVEARLCFDRAEGQGQMEDFRALLQGLSIGTDSETRRVVSTANIAQGRRGSLLFETDEGDWRRVGLPANSAARATEDFCTGRRIWASRFHGDVRPEWHAETLANILSLKRVVNVRGVGSTEDICLSRVGDDEYFLHVAPNAVVWHDEFTVTEDAREHAPGDNDAFRRLVDMGVPLETLVESHELEEALAVLRASSPWQWKSESERPLAAVLTGLLGVWYCEALEFTLAAAAWSIAAELSNLPYCTFRKMSPLFCGSNSMPALLGTRFALGLSGTTTGWLSRRLPESTQSSIRDARLSAGGKELKVCYEGAAAHVDSSLLRSACCLYERPRDVDIEESGAPERLKKAHEWLKSGDANEAFLMARDLSGWHVGPELYQVRGQAAEELGLIEVADRDYLLRVVRAQNTQERNEAISEYRRFVARLGRTELALGLHGSNMEGTERDLATPGDVRRLRRATQGRVRLQDWFRW